MDNLDLSRLLWDYLQKYARGHKNAINPDSLLKYLWLFEPGLRDTRFCDIYSRLPVCICKVGIYIPITPNDVEEFHRYVIKTKTSRLLDQIRTVLTYYPEFAPVQWKQKGLF